jgi:hypothetical protein
VDHLLALARISDQEKWAAVAQPHVRELDDLIDSAELDMLVTEDTPRRAQNTAG